jgi:hypothetical protein
MTKERERQHAKGIAVLNVFFSGRPDMLIPSRITEETRRNKKQRVAKDAEK